jgi:hypothetical protein
MPYINIDIGDLYDDLDRHDKESLVEWLKEDGYLSEYEPPKSALQKLFEEDIEKIRKAYLTISKEDFELINKIAKKY